MPDWNVTMSWFMLRLLIEQMFLGCFDEILVLITVKKSGLGLHIFREGNACADKLANLGFIHK